MAKTNRPKIISQSRGFCGPASLVSLLDYYGCRISEARIARLCRATRDEGTDHAEIVRSLKRLGFVPVVREPGSWTALKKLTDSEVPVLVGWWEDYTESPGDHFSVAYRVSAKSIWLMDPHPGMYRRMSKEKFLRQWYDFDTPQNVRVRRWMLHLKNKVHALHPPR